jgi:hypothetical protein
MTLPQHLTVCDSLYMLDGGTTLLTATDEGGTRHTVMLVQSAFPKVNEFFPYLPGRLYFDEQLVSVRSRREAELIALLRGCEIQYASTFDEEAAETADLSSHRVILGDDIKQVMSRGPEENLRALLAQVIERVESPAYVAYAAEVDRANGTAG